MARPALRDDEIARFRATFCDKALELFATRGYEAVTIRGIARELGCSQATPYRYFPGGKEEVFAWARARAFEVFCDAHEQAYEAEDEPLKRLYAMAQCYTTFAQTHAPQFRLMFDLARHDGAISPQVQDQVRRAWHLLKRALQEARDAGIIGGDLNQLCHLLWGGIHGVTALHLADRLSPRWSAPALVRDMVTALLAAHRPDPATPTTTNQQER